MSIHSVSRRQFCETLALLGCGLTSQSPAAESPGTERNFESSWKKLTKVEAANLARRNVHGLIRASHGYFEKHGTLPPAVIANPKLPAGKRLSGLVLLLPFLGEKSYLDSDKPCFDKGVVSLGKELFASIDQSKAWDDPANLDAAGTLMPAFLTPRSGDLRTDKGFAVSHFAFVRGNSDGENGAFPGEKGISIADVTDGTVNTLGIGQIHNDLGPWIAEGLGTARQLFAATKESPASFGSRYGEGAMFATVDSMPGFFAINKKSMPILQKMATRSGGELVDFQNLRVENPFKKR